MTLTDDHGLQLDRAYYNCPEVHNPEFTEDEHAAAEIGFEAGYKAALSAQPANLSAALDALNSTGEECEFNDMAAMAFPLDAWNEFEELLNQFIPESKPAITEARVIELARQAGALKASDIYDKESLIVDAGDLIRFAALLAAEGRGK